MVMFDANMILRYLLNDNQTMADKAEMYLDSDDVIITIEVQERLRNHHAAYSGGAGSL